LTISLQQDKIPQGFGDIHMVFPTSEEVCI